MPSYFRSRGHNNVKSLQADGQAEDIQQAISKTHLSFQFREALKFYPTLNATNHVTTHISSYIYDM